MAPTCLIAFDRNRHSVPASFASRPVSLHIYPQRLVPVRLVIVAEGLVVCEHLRIIEGSHRTPGCVIYDWRHYLVVVQRKPEALRSGAPFVDILSLALQHGEQDVLCAVEMALEAGVPINTHVPSLLHRLVDGTQTEQPDVTPPTALSLGKEPEANVARLITGRGKEGTRQAS